MGNPALAGARVVLLDTALASLPIAEADLGIPWNWRIGPASRPVSDETYVAEAFTPAGAGLRPFSVAHVEQPWRTPRTPGDLTIRWTRRSRALSGDSWGAAEAALAEETEAYEVEIFDGATVKRVLSTAISATARMRGRLVVNGATEIRGSLGEISPAHVSLATAIWLQTMVPLTAGDTVELQGYFRVADGYFAADHTSFWGTKIG